MSALPYCSPYILDFVSRDINPISREVDGYFRLLVILIEIIENTDISEWFIPSDLQLQMIDHIDAAEYVQDRREEVTVEVKIKNFQTITSFRQKYKFSHCIFYFSHSVARMQREN